MREGKASATAMFVAWARGLGTGASRPDPFAAAVLPAAVGAPLHAMRRWPTLAAPLRWLARGATAGLIDHVNLRTAAIDRALQRAVADGVDQLVILGAGLDGRAWRLPWLGDVDVVEIDHPDTQRLKRRRSGHLPSTARNIEFVAVDFERESLGARLGESRHRPSARTFWIWEGVTPYLPPAAIESSLTAIAGRSAEGSVLAMTYAVRGITPIPVPGLERVVDFGFRTLGEPLLGLSDPQDIHARLRRHGYQPTDDSDQLGWADGRRLESALAFPFRAERLVEAVRR